jgi:hypothetical protein
VQFRNLSWFRLFRVFSGEIEPETGFCDVKLTDNDVAWPMRREECTHTRIGESNGWLTSCPLELPALPLALAIYAILGTRRLTRAA